MEELDNQQIKQEKTKNKYGIMKLIVIVAN